MQIQDFYSGSTQPSLCPLFSSLNPKLEVPLFQGFQTKLSSKTRLSNQAFKQNNWIVVPIHTLGLLAPSTFYNPQEIPHS